KGGVTLVRVQPGKAFDWHRNWKSREGEKERSADGETILSPVSPGTYCLVGGAKGFAHSRLMEIELRPGEVRRGVAVQVRRPAKLAGRFHPEGKFPIAGDVELRSLEVGIVRETRLDATRSFVFEGLAPGQYRLTSEKREGRPHVTELIEIVEGEDREVLFGNPEDDRYTLTLVVSRGGEPLVGAPCRILTSRDGQELSALTDEEGKARFQPAVRDSVDIFVGLEDPACEVPFTWWIPPAEDFVPITRLFPGQPNPVLELDVPVGVLRGRVLFADGQPASAVSVVLDAPHGFRKLQTRRETLTGRDGEFLFAGILSGTCRASVVFKAQGRSRVNQFVSLEVLEEDPCEHELRLHFSR
ncbi:MAG: carboxypeptidase-like regulatory domain-containing protein, partial [Planctomycetota bacterium]